MPITSIKSLPILTASASIEIAPLSRYQASDDLARVNVSLQLQQPLAEETKFLIPNEEFKSQKVYLPDGNQAIIGDFDPAAAEDIENIKSIITQNVNTFIQQPDDISLKNAVTTMTDYYEYRKSSKVVTIPAGTKYVTFNYTKPIVSNVTTNEYLLETIVPLPSFTLTNNPGSKASIIILMPFEINNVNNVTEAVWTPPNGSQTPLDKAIVGGRVTLTGYWQYDPAIRIRYKY